MRIYSDPTRENDKWALPDVEVFHMSESEAREMLGEESEGGWFYQFGFPGCMPDSDPIGPYATHDEAIDAMREEI